jgi:hypothetical protein
MMLFSTTQRMPPVSSVSTAEFDGAEVHHKRNCGEVQSVTIEFDSHEKKKLSSGTWFLKMGFAKTGSRELDFSWIFGSGWVLAWFWPGSGWVLAGL